MHTWYVVSLYGDYYNVCYLICISSILGGSENKFLLEIKLYLGVCVCVKLKQHPQTLVRQAIPNIEIYKNSVQSYTNQKCRYLMVISCSRVE